MDEMYLRHSSDEQAPRARWGGKWGKTVFKAAHLHQAIQRDHLTRITNAAPVLGCHITN